MGSQGNTDPGANTEASETIHRLELLAHGLSTSSKHVQGHPVAAGPEWVKSTLDMPVWEIITHIHINPCRHQFNGPH